MPTNAPHEDEAMEMHRHRVELGHLIGAFRGRFGNKDGRSASGKYRRYNVPAWGEVEKLLEEAQSKIFAAMETARTIKSTTPKGDGWGMQDPLKRIRYDADDLPDLDEMFEALPPEPTSQDQMLDAVAERVHEDFTWYDGLDFPHVTRAEIRREVAAEYERWRKPQSKGE